MRKFLDDVAGILETDRITPDLRFRESDGWCSLKGFALLVLLENDYGKPMMLETFLKCQTVGDLASFAGVSQREP